MNKMQALAKTLITILGVYWLIMMGLAILQVVQVMMIPMFMAKRDTSDIKIMILFSLIMVFIILVISGILKKRDTIALKIAGSEEIQNVDTPVKWIPFAYRLVSVIAGMYCFYRVASYFPGLAIKIRAHSDSLTSCYTYVVMFLLMTVGIYLLCGAPHFVRWQTKKTIEMFEEI